MGIGESTKITATLNGRREIVSAIMYQSTGVTCVSKTTKISICKRKKVMHDKLSELAEKWNIHMERTLYFNDFSDILPVRKLGKSDASRPIEEKKGG
ncbi:hypothetical protein PUN28_013451 [Cardiocondyla obscurior]|uniref:Uncharacterized protein n=1 Tax=Cardiocondyla obscurior TaxID=286306 RepID=A0AAW2F2W8_9HYME